MHTSVFGIPCMYIVFKIDMLTQNYLQFSNSGLLFCFLNFLVI